MVTMVRLASKSLWLSERVSGRFHVELYHVLALRPQFLSIFSGTESDRPKFEVYHCPFIQRIQKIILCFQRSTDFVNYPNYVAKGRDSQLGHFR